MRTANGRMEESLTTAFEAITTPDNDRRAGCGPNIGGRARVIAVHVREENRCEFTTVGFDLSKNCGGTRCEARVDQGELTVIGFNEEDVGTTSVVQPPESRREQVSQKEASWWELTGQRWLVHCGHWAEQGRMPRHNR